MCLILREKPCINIATEDIEVAKYGIIKEGHLRSFQRRKLYLFNEEYTNSDIQILESIIPGEYITKDGLYSINRINAQWVYKDIIINCYLNNVYTTWEGKFAVCKAIIPKGSKYVKTPGGCFISNKLIVLNEVIPNKVPLDFENPFCSKLKEIFY